MTEAILRAMRARDVTQAQLAHRIGMSPSLLGRMLRNPDHNYTVKTLERIAAALDAPLHISLGDD